MGMEEKDITQGQIWEVVTDGFYTTKDKKHCNRKLHIEKGEKIEIRYPFAWHYRTTDNHYLHSEPSEIIKHCRLYGTIWPKIKEANNANLEEILRLKLFDLIKSV